jgi:hypothetical protein
MRQREAFSKDDMVVHNLIHDICRQNAEGLLACHVSTGEAERELRQFVPQLVRFVANVSSGDTVLQNSAAQPSLRFRAESVESVEEPIVSPELGLKGNIDMLVRAVTSSSAGGPQTKALVGVELKTGHLQTTQTAHMAQLALYILLLQARNGKLKSHPGGMLLYMNNEAICSVHVSPVLGEIKTLIGQRNLVASEQMRVSKPRGVVVHYDENGDHSANIVGSVYVWMNVTF